MSTTVRSHKAAAEKLSKGFTFSYRDFHGFRLHVVSPDPVLVTGDTDDFTREVLKHHNIRKDRYLGLGTREPLADAPLYIVHMADKEGLECAVAAKREGVISSTEFREEGAVAGATREALSQVNTKALGLNVGGKIGVARSGSNIAVAVFFGIGLLHLNEVAVGLGHRAI